METDSNPEESLTNSIDEVLSALNILKITTGIKDYESWLKAYYNRELDGKVVEGYKFFIATTIRFLIHAVEFNYSLRIEEDYTFFRARFKGVPIEDIPNTSEKTIFIKNIWSLSKPLRKAKNWRSIKLSVKHLKPLTEVFEEIYRNATPTIDMSKDLALNIVTKFYTLIFLNDTRRGIPYGYISPSIIKVSATSEYLKKVF